MTNSIKYVVAVGSGIAIGVAVSWTYLKTKYEQYAQEQIEDVKEYYKSKYSRAPQEEEAEIAMMTEQAHYEALAGGYSAESGSVNIEDDDAPFVITPEELGDVDEYDTTTLYYYEDGILTNLDDEIVDDVEGTVGVDFAEHFGEYEDDSVCVRNPAHKCDYEILKDLRRYEDVKKPIRPHEAEE